MPTISWAVLAVTVVAASIAGVAGRPFLRAEPVAVFGYRKDVDSGPWAVVASIGVTAALRHVPELSLVYFASALADGNQTFKNYSF
jgi:hypothetical protein